MMIRWWNQNDETKFFLQASHCEAFLVGFQFKLGWKIESSPEISGDMVSLHNMVSPQNGDTRGGLPPPIDTTAVPVVRI